MDEEEIVVGAQLLGVALKALGLILLAAFAAGAFWLWRRFA